MNLNQLIAEYESKKDSYSPEKQAQIEWLIQQAQAKYWNQRVSVTWWYNDAQGNRREEYSDGTTKMVEAAPKKVSAPVTTKAPVKKQNTVNNNVNVPETVEQPDPVTLYNVYQNAKNNWLLEDYYKWIAWFDASKLTTQLMNEWLSDEQMNEWMSWFRDYVSTKEQNSKKSNNQNNNNQPWNRVVL